MTNVDPNEIAKFSALAKTWWDSNGSMKPLHELNPLRLQYIKKYAELENKYILDIGCGGGILTESLAHSGANATGIDLSEDAIAIATAHAEKSALNIQYEKIAVEDFAQKNPNAFDVITCMEMLEHVPDPLSIIHAATHLLKPHGFIFFSTINRNMKSFFEAILGAEYILNLLPKGTHHYQKFIRPSELTRWAEKNNLVVTGIQGVTYHLLTKQFSFCDSVDVNYLMVFRKCSLRQLRSPNG
ncbi:MAG: 3-demethylubiquinone-9 3-O-methyltransferase [uncultured bacterium]|nr:MAG: 3-demethylubiquinone-9 3-O-methyltransferase [uncultured bacterium]OGT32416.1 MAG: bifunctional 3-demethylubiquinol 3-O-methyltransferase/2-polyprenyl-6-hydroxyphenol methylase [Gammaproteobacteria bacterium RIFCSPHIGHO2_02_FULL_39_13]OGT48266.1 MAG: bifunctional 3-demethylubiquinol 3-O-methyltransferase/2-polyprenyl-6-hydroxyphenol methylase [Gammaproteobacteria bacterium RIFCSPHIGHO2_12_FULL_39_24]